MKLNKARRLSLRVPVIGWEAYVSTNSSEYTRAKIANVSADGAYLITREQYQPASTVALSIKSPIISFSVTGMVVRNDPYDGYRLHQTGTKVGAWDLRFPEPSSEKD